MPSHEGQALPRKALEEDPCGTLLEPVSRSVHGMAFKIVGAGGKAAEATSADAMSKLWGWKA